MLASVARRSPFVARSAFGVALLLVGTEQAAYQDLASLFVNQPGVAERARSLLQASSFASLRMATFSLPNPIGAAIPRLPIPDHFAAINASLPAQDQSDTPGGATSEVPAVEVDRKADRIAPAGDRQPRNEEGLGRENETLPFNPGEPRADFAGIIARNIEPVPSAGAVVRIPGLFFGADNATLPPLVFEHAAPSPVERLRLAALPGSTMNDATMIAPKGLITGESAIPKSPAERLAIFGTKRAKAEKCLADAVYFESRGESERGQIAVAQVVVNRVFSGFYPEDVCEAVYQNAHRYLACQFTFACEGKKLIVNDQAAWERATRIAREMLDGRLWLADVGKATHYHAYWVKPDWVREMRTIQRIGVHTFYRPRAWDENAS